MLNAIPNPASSTDAVSGAPAAKAFGNTVLTPGYLLFWRVAIEQDGGGVVVFADDVPDPQVLDDIRDIYASEPVVRRVDTVELDTLLERAARGPDTAAHLVQSMGAEIDVEGDTEPDVGAEVSLDAQVQDPPVVRLVDLLLREALAARASDVHLEATTEGLRTRYRIDGVLVDAPAPPRRLAPALIGRLKVLSDLDVAERRRPQDGRVRLRLEDRSVDVRVSTMPSLHGESVVLRLLESGGRRLSLTDLGLDTSTRGCFEQFLARPHGVLLATGPTGSGKTTTLYAALSRLRTGREKIVTVEDPVEYALSGITQVPINVKAGVSFAAALRSILRQDPDIVMVGELRDAETADICVRAALTGHLVLSTLHTNDAAGALVRLLDLGVEPYLVASTVECVLAQRLVRVVCGTCAEDVAPTAVVARSLAEAGHECAALRRGSGCAACTGTGYRGRTGIYELLPVSDAVRELVLARSGAVRVRELAVAEGMKPLRVDGWRQVAAGITTPEEVARVCQT